MANPNDPKVVAGGDVKFDSGSAPQADTLDGVVKQVAGSQVTGSWVVNNINYLADQVWPLLKQTGWSWDNDYHRLNETITHFFPPHVQGLLVQVITLQQPKADSWHAKINFGFIDPPTFRCFLEAEYHPDIANSGIYQATGLDRGEPLSIDTLDPFFPEIQTLKEIKGRFVPCVESPYANLLTMPPRVRPLLTGALREASPPVDNTKLSKNFPLSLTLKEILSYAQQVNELERVAEYMELLKEKPK